ncbi:patatin family protein [Aeromonas bestiarum]|uniref:patatin-like phospholipase family protein n=1 Tax=Aeromonas bestiarum TaxID=105751 RepID=UPI000CD3DE8E|nr:patatin family protein [Aeromonas bestiarum]POG24351.1 patatin family protein [Aeromonas bestiarum]
MLSSPSTALIVEGGAMRGIFASGVLDAFVESRYYPFDLIIGVSAGATNLVSYLSEQPRRSHHIITELACSSDFLDLMRFVKGGDLVDIGWLWRTSRHRFPLDLETFCAHQIPFYAVATDVTTGAAVYLQVRPDNMDEVLTATCALPVVQHDTPCVDGRPMADGGISDSIPVIEAYRRGVRRMTVVLSEPHGYRKKPPRFCWMLKALLKTQPALVQALLERDRSYNSALDFIANPPADCEIEVIAPPADFRVSRFTQDLSKLESGYLQGYWLGRQSLLRAADEAREVA